MKGNNPSSSIDIAINISYDMCEEMCRREYTKNLLDAIQKPYRDMLLMKIAGLSIAEIASKYAITAEDIERHFLEMKALAYTIRMAG